jgi:hypothetical protein
VVSDNFMSAFQMELNDYPHFYLTEDGRLCPMGQHCLGFLRMLYDTLIHLATTRALRSTVADCPRSTAWTGVRLA